MKAIQLKSRTGPYPLVCAPLVARTRQALLAEAASVSSKGPDLLEWRVDFFEGIADIAETVDLARRIRTASGLPILFTRRCEREGGEKLPVSEDRVVDLYRAICEAGDVDLVDFEMANNADHLAAVRQASRAAGIGMVMSFHDFSGTPEAGILVQHFLRAESQGADVAKIAVMPRSMHDVLALLAATLQASERLSIPVVSMSMGGPGALTRVCGSAFGSAMTFAVGSNPSAPGQLRIEDVQAALAMLRAGPAASSTP